MEPFYYDPEDWEMMADTPEEFEEALKTPFSEKEREFLEQLRYKIPNEIAASNEVLLKDDENEDGLYMLRVGSGDLMIVRIADDPEMLKIQMKLLVY